MRLSGIVHVVSPKFPHRDAVLCARACLKFTTICFYYPFPRYSPSGREMDPDYVTLWHMRFVRKWWGNMMQHSKARWSDPGLNRMLWSSSSCLWGFIFGVHRVRLGDQIGSFMLTFRNVGVTCYIHFVVNIPKYWYKSEFHYLTRGDTRNLFECVFSLNHLLQWFDISSVWCNIIVGVIVEVSIFFYVFVDFLRNWVCHTNDPIY